MKSVTTRFWALVVLLGLLGSGLVQSSSAQCGPNNESDYCSATHGLSGNVSPLSVNHSNPNLNIEQFSIENPLLPSAGALVYADYVEIEERAHELLAKALKMRESISPYKDDNDFDTHLRKLNFNAGWEDQPYGAEKPGYETATSFAQLVEMIEKDLREARDLYAFLSVFAPEARFRADPNYINNDGDESLCGATDKEDANPQSDPTEPTVLPPVIDWCNFQARLRQSMREVVNVRMIVGQEFMVDALGVNFSSGFAGGETIVRDEVAQLRAARYQFEQAEAFMAEGLTIKIGNGCLISDFYKQTEWSLLMRASARQSTVQYHIASRESYLNIDLPSQVARAQDTAQTIFRQSANDAHIKLIGMAALRNPVVEHCQIGERPDGDLIAEMALSQLETKQRSREMAAGVNIFGFDVTMTPARKYASGSTTNCDSTAPQGRGLWDEAWCNAEQALIKQVYEENKTRIFDTTQMDLNEALMGIRSGIDSKIFLASGCSRNDFDNDADFYDCAQRQVEEAGECWRLAAIDSNVNATTLGWVPPARYQNFDICMASILNEGTDLRTALNALRSHFLDFQATQKRAENVNKKIQNSNDANATVTKWMAITGSVKTAAQVAETALGIAQCPIVSLVECRVAGSLALGTTTAVGVTSTIADVSVSNAKNEKEIKNLLLEMSELVIDSQSARRTFLAKRSDVEGGIDLLRRNVSEAKRQRAYFAVSPANDPSFRIMRDSARIGLAESLERAARLSYLAARRAEYEHGIRLSANGFAISDIYRARTALDIQDYLRRLDNIVNTFANDQTRQPTQIDLKASVAQDILLLTDDLLRSEGFKTPEAIEAERIRRFRLWVADNTVTNPEDGKPVLQFNFATSLNDGGLFSNLISQAYDEHWLIKLGGVGTPFSSSNGISVNLVSEQNDLSFRKVTVTQGGTVHLRSFAGCVFDYRLISLAKLLGREWPENQDAESVTATFNANVNDGHDYSEPSYRNPVFDGQPISAMDWQVEIRAGTPQVSLGLPEMDLQKLNDVELNLSATYASRQRGTPNPADCARIDY